MKLELKPFQEEAVAKTVAHMRAAWRESRTGSLQAIVLSAPTASGKTVIATAALEAIVAGDEVAAGDDRAVVLWVTDLPELNEQTRRKMDDYSSVFKTRNGTLVLVDTDFDVETFTPGRVYFLNTQKLVAGRTLVSAGDDRQFTIWETVANTLADDTKHLYCVIDEAHRGMTAGADREVAQSIIQKFILGSPGEISPMPVIVGISATPERFAALLGTTVARTTRPVPVPATAVRESGLLKERVSLFHPTEGQPADMTLLRRAASDWGHYTSRWAAYSETYGAPLVTPILIVQVLDGDARHVTRTDLAEVIAVIRDEVGGLEDAAFAHAFQDGDALTLGTSTIRYLAPPDIDRDPEVRVVFFKTSLNVGWDCPRAEVMMSFRTAVDATHIAQLVGRMVRTPLVRRIEADDFLNSVALHLPHYDATELARVVERLTEATDNMVEIGEPPVALRTRADTDLVFAAFEALPSYAVPRVRHGSDVRRLAKLARALDLDGLDTDVEDREIGALADVLVAAYARLRDDAAFQAAITENGTLDVRQLDIDPFGQIAEDHDSISVTVSPENIEDLFEAAGRRLGEGLHRAYWRMRVDTDPAALTTGRVEIVAIAARPTEVAALRTTARDRANALLAKFETEIAALPEERRQVYTEIRGLAGDPSLEPLRYPDEALFPTGTADYPTHVYVAADGSARIRVNAWESAVIEAETARTDHLAWLRNLDRKPWSLAVPYEFEGERKPVYPDLLFARTGPDGNVIVDLLDPHLPRLDDAPAKAIGLAKYALLHGGKFGRIEIIRVRDNVPRALDLKNATIRDQILKVTTTAHLQALFDTLG